MSKSDIYYQLLPFVVLYFTANNFLLPHGLLFTTLLTPVFLYWLYKNNCLGNLLKWTLLLLIPIPFQLLAGVDLKTFTISTTLVITAWVFLFAALLVVRKIGSGLGDAFKVVLIINSGLILVAFVILPIAPIREMMWYSIPISPGIAGFPRLKLLAYESSHYALLMTPVFLYFILRFMLGQSRHPLLVLLAVVVPLLLSLSFGVMAALIIALIIGTISFIHFLPGNYFKVILYGSFIILLFTLFVYFLWPENPVYTRIVNIFSGKDTSAQGRLQDSFMFAYDLIKNQKILMGIGPGQIKVLAHDLIINYYKYTGEFAEVVRIPNSMAEMLATYGIYGFVLKIFFQLYFFIRLKIYFNLYNLMLFAFMFIYQFTGSFTVNIAELGTWAIVFQSRFNEFSLRKLKSVNK